MFEACSSNSSTDANPKPAQAQLDFGNVGLSPTSGTGREAIFHMVTSGGSQKPSFLGLLINGIQSGEHACYVIGNLVTNDILLVADSGIGTSSLGKQKSISNHQCEVVRDGSASGTDRSGLNVTFHVRFLPGFEGAKQIWGIPENIQMKGPDLVRLGDWTVQ
jgi:hypothetical protein